MKKHTLRLLGGSTGTVRVPAEALLEAIGALVDGARLATRFLVEGESTRKGSRPAWLDAACALEVTGLRSGSAIVDVEAPVLGDVVGSDRLRQLPLFARPTADFEQLSAVECFADVLSSVLAGDRDEVVADRALLDACVRFARSGSWGFEGVELTGLAHRASIALREADVPRMELLRDETPGPRAVRVAGVLDTISATKTDILLALANGEHIGARLEGAHIESTYKLREALARPFVCVVSNAEAQVIARRNGWGESRLEALVTTLSNLVTVDIRSGPMVDAYVAIELASQAHPDGSRNMGKNDLWIAAAAKVARATLLTTDDDFAHLAAEQVAVEVIDPAVVRKAPRQ
jgi:predicted nucleic acid-binding protein